MYFKCLNAKELFEQLNIEILQELEVFVTKQYVYDLFIKKKQKKVNKKNKATKESLSIS